MIKHLAYFWTKYKLAKKLDRLPVASSGSADGLLYVQIEDGTKFFGPETPIKEHKYYRFLSSSLRDKIPFTHFKIAQNILIRYYEGGLKYEGPRKENFYSVKEGDVVSEMGAFEGYYTLYLANQVGASGNVIAIEPIPENIKFLEANIKYNGITNVQVVPRAVWSENMTLQFSKKVADGQSGSVDLSYEEGMSYDIRGETLDHIHNTLNINEVNFMIIQLNGAELRALQGLENFKPKNIAIAARYEVDGSPIQDDIKNLLEDRGYQVVILERDYIFASLAKV